VRKMEDSSSSQDVITPGSSNFLDAAVSPWKVGGLVWEGIALPPPVRASKVTFCLVLFHHPSRLGEEIPGSWERIGVLP